MRPLTALLLLALLRLPSSAAPLPRWEFARGTAGWQAAHDCTLQARDGLLHIEMSGPDPFLHSPAIRVQGPVFIRFTARVRSSGQGRLYWTTLLPSLSVSNWGEDAVVYYDLKHDGEWHDYSIPIDTDATITQLRIDPGKSAGTADLREISVVPFASAMPEAGASAKLPPLAITNGSITMRLEPAARRFTVSDHRTGRTWTSERFAGVLLTDACRISSSRMLVRIKEIASGLPATVEAAFTAPGVLRFKLGAPPDARFSRLAFPPRITSPCRDGAIVFTNRSCGQLLSQREAANYPSLSLLSYGNLGLDMPWVGLVDRSRGDGMMALLETPCDAAIDLATDRAGLAWPQVRWLPTFEKWGYTRVVSYRFIPSGGYVGLAREYRKYAAATGQLVALVAKARRLPAIARLRGAPSMWGFEPATDGRLGAATIARQMRAAGIGNAILNLATNVESAQIAPMNRLGFLTGEYDNYDDLRDGPNGITTGPVKEQAIHLAGGGLARGWVNDDGSQMYRRSSAVAPRVAAEVVARTLKERPFTARFLDVSSAVDLMEDRNPARPYDRRGDLANRLSLYRTVRGLGLVVGGEHGKAWSVPVLDYAEGKLSGAFWWEMPAGYLRPPKSREDIKANYIRYGINPAVRIPLWELVFHDCVVSSWYWGDGPGFYHEVAPEMDDFQDLTTMLYGGVPLFWINNLGYGWNRNRPRLLESYAVTCKLHEAIGFDRMTGHQCLTTDGKVQATTWSSGARVVVNYDTVPRRAGGATLAPLGFLASAPGIRQQRTTDGHTAVTTVDAPGYHYAQRGVTGPAGPFVLSGRAIAVRETARSWRIWTDAPGPITLNVHRLAPMSGPVRLTRLTDEGSPIGATSGTSPSAPLPGSGMRLYRVAW